MVRTGLWSDYGLANQFCRINAQGTLRNYAVQESVSSNKFKLKPEVDGYKHLNFFNF